MWGPPWEIVVLLAAVIVAIQLVLLVTGFVICRLVIKSAIDRRNSNQTYETPSRSARIMLLCLAWTVAIVNGVIAAQVSAKPYAGDPLTIYANIIGPIAFFPMGLVLSPIGLLRLVAGNNGTDVTLLISYIGTWVSYIMLVVGALLARRRKSSLVVFVILCFLLALNSLGWLRYSTFAMGS